MLRLKYFLLFAAILIAVPARATTYYIAANGSDTNNGTTKGTPWAHAPGMKNCASVCASTTPQPGDSFILRGGDTWNYDSSGGLVGLPWNWTWSGTSGSCNIDLSAGAYNFASCIYVGVDQTWFTGASWVRPKMNMDNPASTSYVGTCAFDQSNINIMSGNAQYLILDNFEWQHWCWSSSTESAKVIQISANTMVENMYYDSWTVAAATALDQFLMIGPITCCTNQVLLHNVFDGSNSTLSGSLNGTGVNRIYQATGKAIGAGTELGYNVFYHVSNGYVSGGAWWIHDNWGTQMWEPTDCSGCGGGSTHGNIIEQLGPPSAGTYFYNNNFNTTNIGEGINLYSASGFPVWIFNNISFLYSAIVPTGTTIINGTRGADCFLPENTGGSGARTWNIFNNTLDSPCSFSQKNISLTQVVQNNHLIGFSPAALSTLMNATITDNGNETFQTESVANGQGYLPGNNYAPTTGGSTIGAGANLTSKCNTIPISAIVADCKLGFRSVTYNQTTNAAITNTAVVARPATGAWDSGAYQVASVTLAPASQNFGSVNVGFTGTPTTFTLTNSSATTVTGISAGFVGGNSGDWTNTGAGTCGSTLAASSSCTLIVEFVPTVTGARSTTLTVTDSAASSPQTSALTGTGSTAGSVTVSPTSNNFGSVTVGSTSAAATFTLSNTTGVSLTGITVTFIGTNASDFAQSGGSCGSTLASGSTCTILATFTPAATGARSGALNIADSDPSSPQTSTFIGTGVSAGSVTLNPGTQNFGSINLGSASSPVTFTLSNTTPSGLTGIAITLIGTNAADYAQTGGTCSTTLGASSTCTIILTFTPSAAGTRTATLNVADSATSSPQQSALVGNGNTITPLPGPCPVCFE